MDRNTTTLSICIVNWNTEDLLNQCLKSIYDNLSISDFEVLIVDNASTDGSVAMLKRIFPTVRVIVNDFNVGFAKANNQMMRISTSKYILLLNTDTMIKPGAIEALLDFMEMVPRAGACGPKLFNPDGSWQSSFRTFPSLYNELIDQIRFNFPPVSQFLSKKTKTIEKYLNKNGIIPVDVISAACILVRKEVVNEVGLMNESFFLFSEENDWCLRMQKHGWMRYFVPKAEVIHLTGKSRKKLGTYQDTFNFFKSRVKYFNKHFGTFTSFIVKQMYVSFFYWRMIWNLIALIIKFLCFKNPERNIKNFYIYLRISKNLHKL